MTKQPCNNCGSLDWVAWNPDYCTCCERDFWQVIKLVISPVHNPVQDYVDSILEKYGI